MAKSTTGVGGEAATPTVAKAMSAATPLITRKLRLNDTARLVEESRVGMADSIRKIAKTRPGSINQKKRAEV
jgi:hypothetical protein